MANFEYIPAFRRYRHGEYEEDPLEITHEFAAKFWNWVDDNLEGELWEHVVTYPIIWNSYGFLEFVEQVVAKSFNEAQRDSFCELVYDYMDFDFPYEMADEADYILEDYPGALCEDLYSNEDKDKEV